MPKAVPVDYQSTVKKPDDFDAFWDGVQQQAAATPLEPEIIPDLLRTSEAVEVFQVFYTSLEHVRIAAVVRVRPPPWLLPVTPRRAGSTSGRANKKSIPRQESI